VTQQSPDGSAQPTLLQKLLHRRESGIFLALLGLIAVITALKHNFIDPNNVYLVSRQIALTAIVALGVFFVILTGGIDLSLGSTITLSGFMAGLAMAAGLHPLIAIMIGLLTGSSVGAINGVIVAFIGVTPFIVTLGMLGVASGLVLVIKHGDSVRQIPPAFIAFGNGSLLGLSVPVIILGFISFGAHVVLKHTAFGRRIYAIGGNEEATALSGINTRRVKFLTYVICGGLSSVTGILYIARFQSAQADAGKGKELDAIAAAVIGGTSLMGGEGTVVGVLIGAIIMGVIRNGLVLTDVSPYWQELIIGTIIVLAAILDIVRSRRRR
jgi:ribose/xylose/arabinose/galactoside ABC-type transport system permease subunit